MVGKMTEKEQITVTSAENGIRIDRLLADRFPELTRSYIQKMIRDGDVLANEKLIRASYKAAEGDVIHLELPALVPTIVILLIMNMGRVLSVGFEKVFLMQNDLNLSVSEVISTYVFNVGVQSGQFSFGSAVGLFNTVINFAFLMLANCVAKKTADISLM